MLFPIDWPEPFGLVMVEALACGTPVIARRLGAVPEVALRGVHVTSVRLGGSRCGEHERRDRGCDEPR